MSLFTPTSWRFVTSEGIDTSVAVLGLAVAGQVGRLYVHDPRREQHRFQYICVGAGFGVGYRGGSSALLQALRAAGLDVFSTGLPSGNIGTIWKGPGVSGELTEVDFIGDCVMLVGQAGAITGGSIALIICAPPGTLKLVGITAAGSALAGPASLLPMALLNLHNILTRSRCAGLLWGISTGLQLGAGIFTLYGTLTPG